MTYLENFAQMGPDGTLERLQCKICGTVIGEKQQRTIGFRKAPDGRVIERIIEGFTRNHLYTEIKIIFDDGSAHVTNGCKTCLMGNLSVEALSELTSIDERDLKLSPRKGAVIEVVETKIGGGIV
jgi:hypothetical protein